MVYRNQLIELIQYAPATETVRPEPILIVPAWIMKYYILDLSPQNSLVRYLTEQGFTVFMISWKNPTKEDRELGLDDYRQLGVMAALDVVAAIVPDEKVHGVGYCLGGTLLSIAAAAMARDGDERLKRSASCRAAGFHGGRGAHALHQRKPSPFPGGPDVAARAISTPSRWPAPSSSCARMTSSGRAWCTSISWASGHADERPHGLERGRNSDAVPHALGVSATTFPNNDLAEGRFQVEGRPIALTDIRAPIFAVGTERDHVAPWRSAFKIQLLTDTDVTFLLTTGGHNAGIVSEPGHGGRSYRVLTKGAKDRYIAAGRLVLGRAQGRRLLVAGVGCLAWRKVRRAAAAPPNGSARLRATRRRPGPVCPAALRA